MNYIVAVLAISIFAEITSGVIIQNLYHALETAFLKHEFKPFVENFKFSLKSGNETFGIPCCEPYREKQKNIAIVKPTFSISGTLNDLKVDGLSNYTIHDARFLMEDLTSVLNLTWSKIQIKSLYSLFAILDEWPDFPVYGNGNVNLNITNLNFGTNISFVLSTNGFCVEQSDVDLNLGGIKISITGMYDDDTVSEILADMMNKSLVNFLYTYHSMIRAIVQEYLKEWLNSYICNNSNLRNNNAFGKLKNTTFVHI